jgi:hypothetical protein
MSTLRKIAEIPAGSWTKWIVVGFWVVLLIILFPLQSKLTGAEKTTRSSGCPPTRNRPRSLTCSSASCRPTSSLRSWFMSGPRA